MRNKTLFIAISYIMISFATISYFFYTSYKMVEKKQLDVIALELDNTTNEIALNFQEVENALLFIETFLNVNQDDAMLLDLIVEIDQDYEEIASIYLGKPDKTMVNSTGFVPGEDFDLTTRPWYIMGVGSNDIVFTSSFINATRDRVIVTAAKAITIDDVFIGVLAIDIDVRTITGFVAEKKIGENGFALLIDGNQNLIAYPELNFELISLTSIEDYDFNLVNIETSGLISDFKLQDQEGIFSYELMQPYGYTLAVFIPNNEYMAGLRTMSRIFLYMDLILLIAALILVIIYNLRVKKPLELFLSDIEKVNIIDSTTYRLPDRRRDDYLDIRNALNQILDATDFYFKESKKAQQQLMLENQRVKLLMDSTADIIFEIDINKKFVSVFGRGLDILRMTPDVFIGKTVLDVFGKKGKVRDEMYNQALAGRHCVYDWDVLINDEKRYFESSISPIYNEFKKIIGAVGITRDITEAMEKQREIEYLSVHDFLTGLYNRRYFVEAFAKLDQLANYPLGIMMIDLNGLKILNDAYGHDKGDQALKEVANGLVKVFNNEEIICRIGGDEFAILSKQASLSDFEKKKEDVRNYLSKLSIGNIPISVAIGFDLKMKESVSFEEIMKNAENQMYRNKITEGKSMRNSSIKAILKTLTDKFDEEKTHSSRVSQYCKKMGEALKLKSDDIKELEVAGLFHDIGKISIPDEILKKPSKLTNEEYEIIKSHTQNGYNILRAADEYSNLAEYALSHHEYWNGSGYPRGLKGEEIHLFSRIICVVDAYEAMTSDRIYRKRLSVEYAINELIKYSGTQFDPKLTKIFIEKVLNKEFHKN